MSMFSRTLPTMVIARRSAVVKGSMTPEVILHRAWKKSTECWKSAQCDITVQLAYPVPRQCVLACYHELISACDSRKERLSAYQDDSVLSHCPGDDERIVAEGITILDLCTISLVASLQTGQLTISRFPNT